MQSKLSKILVISIVILGSIITIIGYINKPPDTSMFVTLEKGDILPYDDSYTYVTFVPNISATDADETTASIIAVYDQKNNIIGGTKVQGYYDSLIIDKQLILWNSQNISDMLCFEVDNNTYIEAECKNSDITTYNNDSGMISGGDMVRVVKEYSIDDQTYNYYKDFNVELLFINNNVTYFPADFMYLGGGDNE